MRRKSAREREIALPAVDLRLRLLAAALLVVGLIATFCLSVGAGLAVRSPELALSMAPDNSRVLAFNAEQAFGDGASASSRQRAADLARRALLRDPTNVSAMVTLGLTADIAGQHGRALRWMSLAEGASRRDLRSHVWHIETAVHEGDVAGALRHYDLALRTSKFAPDLMFPTLNGALAEPEVRTAIAEMVSKGVPWGNQFLAQVGSAADDLGAAAIFYREAKARGTVAADMGWVTLAGRLVTQRAFAQGYALFEAMRGIGKDMLIRDTRFEQAQQFPAVFDWTLFPDNGIAVAMNGQERNDGLSFDAPPGLDGPIARQMLLLPPGRYRLETQSSLSMIAGEAAPYWQLACVDGQDIGRLAISGAQPLSAVVSVPGNCPAQWLTFTVRPVDIADGITGRVKFVRLSRTG